MCCHFVAEIGCRFLYLKQPSIYCESVTAVATKVPAVPERILKGAKLAPKNRSSFLRRTHQPVCRVLTRLIGWLSQPGSGKINQARRPSTQQSAALLRPGNSYLLPCDLCAVWNVIHWAESSLLSPFSLWIQKRGGVESDWTSWRNSWKTSCLMLWMETHLNLPVVRMIFKKRTCRGDWVYWSKTQLLSLF